MSIHLFLVIHKHYDLTTNHRNTMLKYISSFILKTILMPFILKLKLFKNIGTLNLNKSN